MRHSRLAKIMMLMGGGGWKPTYLLRDEFTTDDAAPMASPRTCEPGPGALTVVDTTNKAAVASGLLVFSGRAGAGDPGVWGGAQTNAIGLAFFFKLAASDNAASYIAGGWDNTVTTIKSRVVYRPNSQDIILYTAGTVVPGETGYTRNTLHNFALIQRGTGGMFFLGKPNGGAWTLLFVDKTNISTYVYPGIYAENYVSGTESADNLRVVVLPAPWASVNGIATAEVASSGANGTSTMEADGIVEATWQAATGATFNLMFRRTDDDNTWIIRCDQANSKIYLYEKQTGSETERGETGGVAQTFTNGTSYRIWAKCRGNTIEVGVDKVRRIAYTSATFNATATGVKNDLAVTNLISWPRLISGAALDILNTAYP